MLRSSNVRPSTSAHVTFEYETLEVGKAAPHFKGTAFTPENKFVEVCLDDYKGKYLVLFFYPMDFTYVCPTEVRSFSENAENFKKLNCELLACSTDSVYSHRAWTKVPRVSGGVGPVNYPLLSDQTTLISRAFGVLSSEAGIAHRGLFIIDPIGILRQVIINDSGVGRSVDEVLRLVMAYQRVDETGEVCPVNWKPGEQTINPDLVDNISFVAHPEKARPRQDSVQIVHATPEKESICTII